jgi:rhodanese-related sulfurtransferase
LEVVPLSHLRYDGRMEHSKRFEKLCDEARANIEEISTDQVAERIAKGQAFALIDVREESEFAKGRIKGARHMGRGIIERDIEKTVPDLDADIVLYCGGGFRSALSAESLKRMGYTSVKSMAGGWREWNAKKLPTE